MYAAAVGAAAQAGFSLPPHMHPMAAAVSMQQQQQIAGQLAASTAMHQQSASVVTSQSNIARSSEVSQQFSSKGVDVQYLVVYY